MFATLRRTEQRAIQATAWGDWGDSSQTWAGVTVTTSSALQLLTVYGCVRLICDGISTLPVDVLRERPDGTIENITNPEWLEYPMPGLHRSSWLTQVLSSLLLAGNSYIVVGRDQGRIVELVPLDPAKVQVRREGGRKVIYVNGARVDQEILHIPAVMLAGTDIGLSPLEAARQSIGSGLAAQEFGSRYFTNNATLSGVIENPGPLPPEKAKEMARAWARSHSGKARSHLPGVLTDGAVWKPTSVSNEQAQFLETRGFTASEIAGQMFLVDPTDLGIPQPSGQSVTYANIESRNIRRVQITFLPWLVRIEKSLSRLLPAPRYVKFNVNGLLRGDSKTRFESYQIGITSGFLLPNEAREFEDWSPLPASPPPAPATVDLSGIEARLAALEAEPAEPPVKMVERDRNGHILRIIG